MMDDVDLRQTDARRNNLEEDRIILEYAINQLKSYFYENGEDMMHKSMLKHSAGNSVLSRNVLSYKLQQISMFKKIIKKYEDTFMQLMKEDSL